MSLDDRRTRLRRVAVGDTREQAAARLAAGHDEVFLTSYSDFTREVDLAEVEALDLAPGDGLSGLLEAVSRDLHQRDLTVRLALPEADPSQLADLLARFSLQINEVEDDHGSVFLSLGRRGQQRPGQDELVLRALATGSGTPGIERPVAPVHQAEPKPAPPEEPKAKAPGRPEPRLLAVVRVFQRWRHDPRRRTAIGAGVVLALVVLVGLGFWLYNSGSLLAVAVPALIVLVLGSTAFSCYVVLLLARQVHFQTGRLERMVLRNRSVVQSRTSALGKRIRVLEQGQARLPFAQEYLEAIAEASSASATRLRDLTEAIGLDPESMSNPHRGLHLETQRQVQALLSLERLIELPRRVPPMGGWAASPDFNLLILQELLAVRPRIVIECGSGTSTLLMALAVRQYDLPTRIISLEHLEHFKRLTDATLVENDVADLVDVRLAPLAPTTVPEHDTKWYDERALDGLDEIGLVVVDGPPELTGDHARYPAVPLLRAKFAEHVSIVVDDVKRVSDRQVLDRWRDLLPDFHIETLTGLQKHAAVARRLPGERVSL